MLIVGEAPGYSEEKTGTLFSGSAGRYLNEVLEQIGLKREWFFVTNAVKCRPEQNRTPTPSEIKTCTSNYLIQELQEIQPQYGLLLGNGACQAILGKKGITSFNGQIIERHGVQWVPVFHPAAVLRNPRYARPFKEALLIFARLIRDEEGLPVTQTTLVDNKERLRELLAELEQAKWGALDVETWSSHPSVGRFKGGGLAWWHYDWKLCTINFSFKPGFSYVLPLWHVRSPWKDPQKVVDIIKPHVERIKWIMHNGKYDSKCLWRVGINAIHTYDTMGAEYALDENNTKDLGFMSKVYLAAPDYKEMIDKGNIYNTDLELLAEYGGRDSDYTLRLKPATKRALQKDPYAYRLYNKLLLRADRTLTRMEYQGMPLDIDKLEERSIECEKLVAEVEEEVFDLTGWEFNLNSPAQIGDILFNHMGFPVIERTSKGKPSTREGVLLRLADLDETGLMDTILKYRKYQGYLSRYFHPYPILADEAGRIHCHFKPFHTVTGRLSSEYPNLQQVPRDTFVRGLFGYRERGWVILEADYSQVEMRLAAHYSQDKTLTRIFNTGRDVHMEMAMSMTGKLEEDVTPEERKLAKAINFGFLYGMGAKKFMTYAKENYGVEVSMGKAQTARRDYFQNYRSLLSWHDRQRKKAERYGYVQSAIGRKRHLHDIHSSNEEIRMEAQRQAINSPVQSLASDMMLLAMVLLEEKLPVETVRSISTVHDSILFEIREDAVDKWAPVIKETMEDLPLEQEFECILSIPIVADLKVGSYWSEGATAL